MSPEEFCVGVRIQLEAERADAGWARGASALCGMYAGVDAPRFEAILVGMASGRTGSAVAEGSRWLLVRWQALVAETRVRIPASQRRRLLV
jgi:hypothetical protein